MDVKFQIPVDVGLDEGRSLGQIVGQAGPYINELVRQFEPRFAAHSVGTASTKKGHA